MIDWTKEKKLSLSRAVRLPILERDGRYPNPSTAFRWIKEGVRVGQRRIYLEHGSIGARLFTSAEAVERFIERCTVKDPNARPLSEKQQSHELASRRLSADGL